MDKCWYDSQIEAFASKARAFYASCAQTMYPIPYAEEAFVGIVTTGYQMMQSGEIPTIQRIKEELANYKQATGQKVKKKEVSKIFRGEEVGKGSCWQWTNYCWDYIQRKSHEKWLDYNRKVNNSEVRCKAKSDRRLGPLQEDFVCLILTIEYL